jgi:hypothetical protein
MPEHFQSQHQLPNSRPYLVQDQGRANAGGRDEIESSVGEERPCKVVVVVVLLVIDQQRLCNGQEIMRTTTKVKLDIHKSLRGCCSFAAWEGWGHTRRQDRHHHEAHDGGMGSYGDKRARERERDKHTDRPTRVRSFSGDKLPQTATTTTTKKERKKAKEAHRPRSTIMRQKWVYIFPAFKMPGITFKAI